MLENIGLILPIAVSYALGALTIGACLFAWVISFEITHDQGKHVKRKRPQKSDTGDAQIDWILNHTIPPR